MHQNSYHNPSSTFFSCLSCKAEEHYPVKKLKIFYQLLLFKLYYKNKLHIFVLHRNNLETSDGFTGESGSACSVLGCTTTVYNSLYSCIDITKLQAHYKTLKVLTLMQP